MKWNKFPEIKPLKSGKFLAWFEDGSWDTAVWFDKISEWSVSKAYEKDVILYWAELIKGK